ncbi:MFS transporter [Streptomyces nojiriensis]|uniref:MFS transporter n=1 Tax=Streptomyces nojiriensis TaxID=66374 RepID=UPI00369524BF
MNVIAVDAATFLVLAATFLFGVPRGDAPAPAPEEGGSRAAGFAVIRRAPALPGLLALSFAFFCLFGPVYVALPLYVSDGPGAPAAVLAAFYTAFGVGAVLGSVLTGYLGRLLIGPAVTGIVVASASACCRAGLGAPTAVAVAGFAAAGLLWPPYASLSTAFFQRSAPRDLLPQTLAASSAVQVLAVPLGTALGGPLVARLGARGTLLAAAASIAVLGLVAAGAVRAGRKRGA